MSRIFTNWSDQLRRDFRQGVMVARHSLHESPLFTDAALQQLIEKQPRNLKMVYTMPMAQGAEESFREGDLSGRSGAEVLQAVRKGRLWVQLLRLNKTHDEFRQLEQQIIREMKANIPGFTALECKLSLLISSPGINVSYHADIPRNALWHIRGQKRVFIYPGNAPFLSAESLEGVYLGETQETIPYRAEFDHDAMVVDMQPGDVATWPVNAPHRVENQDSLNVSMVMEYFQPHVLLKYGVCYTNGIFRRQFNRPLKCNSPLSPVAWLNFLTGIAFKLLKVQKKHSRPRYLSFELDPSAPLGMVDIERRLRDW